MNQIEMEKLTIIDHICEEDEFLINAEKCMIIARLRINEYETIV
jgi:hypothetical protein